MNQKCPNLEERSDIMQERRSMLPESLRAVANMLEDIQRAQRLTESRLSGHGAELENLRAELQRQINVQERYAKEIYRLKQELDSLKSAQAVQDTKPQKEAPAAENNPAPVKPPTERAPFIPETFYKTAAAPRTMNNYISASVPLGREAQVNSEEGNVSDKTANENSQPVIPGTGFSHITIDFLRKLAEK